MKTQLLSLTTLILWAFVITACGDDGRDGLDGLNGSDGLDGLNGSDGLDGAPGVDALPCSVETLEGGALITCPDGTTSFVPNGQDGADGMTIIYKTLSLSPARDYDPSAFFPDALKTGKGKYTLPKSLPLVAGVAGTGWASIVVEEVRFCYQGNGKNNSAAGTAFLFKGETHAKKECHLIGNLENNGLNFKLDGVAVIEASVHGGGVSAAIRTYTEVEALIQAVILK